MPSVTEITVRYAETDCMGVTHHAVYPVWFEVARTDYIKNAAVSYAEMERRGVMIPVTYVTRFSPARVEFRYECRRKGSPEILTEGTSAHAFVDAETFRPLNFRKALPDIYEKLEKEAQKDLALCAT